MKRARKTAPRLRGEILLVDDDAVFREEFAECFPGYSFAQAGTAEEALAALKKPNRFSLVITDVRLPGLGGLELLGKVRALAPGVPVVVITGNGSKEVVLGALRGHADDYIEKPFNVEKTGEIIARLMGRNGGAGPEAQDAAGRLELLKQYLRRNVARKVSLKDAAGVVLLSPKYLSDFFRLHQGTSFNAYRLRLKMDAAKSMLRATGYNVDQVSERLGYQNTESFIRQFKKLVKCTPAVYRRRHCDRR